VLGIVVVSLGKSKESNPPSAPSTKSSVLVLPVVSVGLESPQEVKAKDITATSITATLDTIFIVVRLS